MKIKVANLLLVLFVMVAILPTGVFAKEPVSVTLEVRNHTGQTAQLNVTDEFGNIQFFDVPTGVSELTLSEGRYSYWTSLKCGNIAGQINVNVVKLVFLDCKDAIPTVAIGRPQGGGPVGDCGYIFYVSNAPNPGFASHYLSETYFDPTAGYFATYAEAHVYVVSTYGESNQYVCNWPGNPVYHTNIILQ